MDKFSRVNNQHWCGWPMIPARPDELVNETRLADWSGQQLIRGEDVVITRGKIHNYNGTVNLKLTRILKDYGKDFGGCYVLARVSLSKVSPTVQIHDVISDAALLDRMNWLSWIMTARKIRESNYEIAPRFSLTSKRPISLRIMMMQSGGELMLKTNRAACKAYAKSTVQTDEWINVSRETEINTFFDKIRAEG